MRLIKEEILTGVGILKHKKENIKFQCIYREVKREKRKYCIYTINCVQDILYLLYMK